MNCEEKRVWGIHAKDEHLFLEDDMIAVAWHEMGDLSRIGPTREAFKAAYAAAYPEAGRSSISSAAGMLYRFVHEMQPGDYVVFPSRMDRQVNIGVVEGAYVYAASARHYAQRRKVKWLRHLPRTSFTQGALYELGACMSLFAVKNYADEFLQALDEGAHKTPVPDEPEPAAAAAENIIESTKDFVLKELSRRFKGHGFEELTADLLRAMGYRATVSPRGGDGGIDIIAYRDELPPRTLVQVKSGADNIREATLQSLKGAMKEGDYGLFVTLADYTKNAREFLEDAPSIRGINGPEFVDLILRYYGGLSERHRRMLPLRTAYIPASADDL